MDPLRDSYSSVGRPYSDPRFSIESANTVHVSYTNPRLSVESASTFQQHYHDPRFSVESSSTYIQKHSDSWYSTASTSVAKVSDERTRLSTASTSTDRLHHARPRFATVLPTVSSSAESEPSRASFVPLDEEQGLESPSDENEEYVPQESEADVDRVRSPQAPASDSRDVNQSDLGASGSASRGRSLSLHPGPTSHPIVDGVRPDLMGLALPAQGSNFSEEFFAALKAVKKPQLTSEEAKVLFRVASVYHFQVPDAAIRESGFEYLSYDAGEIFDIIGERGELWLGWNDDDPNKKVGWLLDKHMARLVEQ